MLHSLNVVSFSESVLTKQVNYLISIYFAYNIGILHMGQFHHI